MDRRDFIKAAGSTLAVASVDALFGAEAGSGSALDATKRWFISAQFGMMPCTLNDTWGYKAHDQNWKNAETIIANRRHLKEIGANYLLNVGPDGLGRIPAPSVDILRAVGKAS